MTIKLFAALYIGLFVGMFVLMFTNFPVGWIFFAFVFIAVFGGIRLINRPYLVAAGFLLTSLLVLGIGIFGMYRSWQVNTWPTAAGEITRSQFCTRTVNGEVVYGGACIEYSYSVNGQEYKVSSIDTGEFEQQVWFSIPERFKEGREVQVFYDPGTPSTSRLTADIPARDWITALVGAIMAALSTVTLVQVLRPSSGSPTTDTSPDIEPERAVPSLDRAVPTQDSREKPMPDVADQLKKLAKLHEEQELTDEEYELAKKRLLGTS